MSGHSRWWLKVPIEPNAPVLLANYIDGYILAMEDILRDLDRFRTECDSDEAIIDSLERSAEESRDSARRTLETLTKKSDTE